MKILIIGAGPLGSLLAARLNEADYDVSLLARGQRLQELKKYGVIIRFEGSPEKEVAKVNIVENFHSDDYYDLVMIVMRKNQADNILDMLSENKRVPTYLFMGNNVKGVENMAQALGKERIMLGFPLPGGSREGHVMCMLPVNEKKKYTLPLGEADGKIRDRTRQIAEILGSMRGYKVQIRKDMENWLKYHAAILIPGFVPAIYAADINMKRLGNTRDLLILAVRATKEALKGLRKFGIPTTPKIIRIFELIPEPFLVYFVGWIMRQEYAKSSIEGHPRDARDEMKYLHQELTAILEKSKVETEAIDTLKKYYDPETSLYPKGSNKIPFKWHGVVIILLIILVLILLLLL